MTENLYDKDTRYLLDNLQYIEENIANAAQASGRKREDIILMAVTKTVDPQRINTVLDAGVRYIGENRVQEFLAKKDALHLDGVSKHLIGHLQTNKIRQITEHVDMIQSVDSIKVAKGISEQAVKLNRRMPVLLEVNIGCEYSKSGVSIQDTQSILEEISSFSGISVQGLMAIPPISENESEKRKVFSKMNQLFIDIKSKKIDNVYMNILSMGMSGDYVQAIMEGATLVRIGTALFGQRVY